MARKKQNDAITDAEKIDRDMAWRAREKERRGEIPTRDELAALKRIEKADEESRRWAYYRTIPKKHWREMSSRNNATISDQAERYGLPFGGSKIDLPEFVRAFHEFLAANKDALNRQEEASTTRDRIERARAEDLEMKTQIKRRELRHVDEVRRVFDFVANTFRRASIELTKEFGEGAHAIIEAAIVEAGEAVEKLDSKAESP